MDGLCIGHAAWDVNACVDGYPIENSKCEIDTMLECDGGPAANAAYLSSQWGVSCAIAVPIGTDPYGPHVVEEFGAVGIDVTLLDQRPANGRPVVITRGEQGMLSDAAEDMKI
jgi:sulfofructose kinase